VTYDPREGGPSARRSVAANDIARIYLSAPAARSVFAGVLNPNATGGTVTTDSRGFGRRRGVLGTVGAQGSAIRVDANRPWTDTGITVRQGDRLTFSSSGQIRVTDGTAPEAVATVDGAGALQAHGSYPVASAPAGALIGRIGNSAAFGIGSQTVLTMPASGRLFLGVNDDHFEDNSGAFTVAIGR
jgi:hypothetical protein